MKQIQSYMSLLMSFFLFVATSESLGCGSQQAAAPVAQQQAANTSPQDPAAQQPPPADPNAPAQDASQDQSQTQLPAVNLTSDGLDELLAPVALYPDPVLAILLQASVDPQQVMDGGNWLALDQNQNLTGDALDIASAKAGFTPVMQALLHYPTVIDLMCQEFDWTKQLGAAYQGDPKAVLASAQRLRAQAVDTGALKSSPQMTVDVKQDQGKDVIELKPTDPQVVYVPQYNPDQVFSTTTTTTRPDGTTTTTTTSSGPAPAAAPAPAPAAVQQQSSGVSTESAVLIGLLSFGAGIAVGAAISSNHYYYPAWGYGGIYYGPRPYYPPPYRPIYYPGWGPGYHYNRPVHYSQTNIYINNNNYYNRFNNNGNLNPGYKPRPVPYNRNANSTYARSMGNAPAYNKGVTYRPPANNYNKNGNNNNWKGQTTYQGNKGGNNVNNRPANGTAPGTRPSNGTAPGTRPGTGTQPSTRPSTQPNRPSNGTAPGGKPATGTQPSTRPSTQPNRPSNGTTPGAKPAPGTQPSTRPSNGTTPGAKPAPGTQPSTRPSNGTTPGAKPAPGTQPSTRPGGTQPSNGTPGAKPAPGNQPSTRPSTQPSNGSGTKPSAGSGAKPAAGSGGKPAQSPKGKPAPRTKPANPPQRQ